MGMVETFELEIRGKDFGTIEKSPPFDRWKCPVQGCKTMMPTQDGVKKHMIRKHEDHIPNRTEAVICENCGKRFTAEAYRDRKYCSHKCANRRRGGEFSYCDECGTKFEHPPHEDATLCGGCYQRRLKNE